MLIQQQKKHYQALNEWFKTPLGLRVSDEFTDQLKPLVDYLKGKTLIQLGNCGTNPWLNILDFNHKWIASPYDLNKAIDLECAFNHIPINRNTFDCVLAPLTLEPFGANLTLIDEIDRIIKPMGFVVLLCINPWSLWGGAMKCGFLSCYADHLVKLRTSYYINKLFIQRGYRQCLLNNFCYIPPINNEAVINKLEFIDEVGKMLWPFPSGFYCYIAQKYEAIAPSPLGEVAAQVVTKKYKSPLQPATNELNV